MQRPSPSPTRRNETPVNERPSHLATLRPASFHRYWAIARRRFVVVLSTIAVVTAAAVGVSVAQSPEYEAISTVLISRQSVANQLSGSSAEVGLQQLSFQQVLTTQAKLARTPSVVDTTIKSAGPAAKGLTSEKLLDRSSVSSDPTSDLLSFAVRAEDPADAVALATFYAESFVRYRGELDSAALTRALEDIDAALARAERRGSTALIQSLTTSRQQLETRLALQSDTAQVVARPEKAEKVRPLTARNIVLALIAGTLLGVMFAVLRELSDNRVRSLADIEAELPFSVLARIPAPPSGEPPSSRLAIRVAPQGFAAESFRILRTNVDFGLRPRDAKVLMVTSATAGEGKSTTIANLALAASLAGRRVVLVDLDLRRSTAHRIFELPLAPGVTNFATRDTKLAHIIRDISIETLPGYAASKGGSLSVVTSGPLPPSPGELVGTPAVAQMLSELRANYDLVLIDAPPAVGVSDTSVIAQACDAIFVCVRVGHARRPVLRELDRVLSTTGKPVIGSAITGDESDDELGYGTYYGYAGYGTDAESEASTRELSRN